MDPFPNQHIRLLSFLALKYVAAQQYAYYVLKVDTTGSKVLRRGRTGTTYRYYLLVPDTPERHALSDPT